MSKEEGSMVARFLQIIIAMSDNVFLLPESKMRSVFLRNLNQIMEEIMADPTSVDKLMYFSKTAGHVVEYFGFGLRDNGSKIPHGQGFMVTKRELLLGKFENGFFTDGILASRKLGFYTIGKHNSALLLEGFARKKYSNRNREECVGNWTNGLISSGMIHYTNGNKYEGPLKDELPHGNGILDFACGNHFEGEFVCGIRDGRGKITFATGGFCEGNWRNNVREGDFVYTSMEGEMFDEVYTNGVLLESRQMVRVPTVPTVASPLSDETLVKLFEDDKKKTSKKAKSRKKQQVRQEVVPDSSADAAAADDNEEDDDLMSIVKNHVAIKKSATISIPPSGMLVKSLMSTTTETLIGVVGCSHEEAMVLMNECDQNVEKAINLYFDRRRASKVPKISPVKTPTVIAAVTPNKKVIPNKISPVKAPTVVAAKVLPSKAAVPPKVSKVSKAPTAAVPHKVSKDAVPHKKKVSSVKVAVDISPKVFPQYDIAGVSCYLGLSDYDSDAIQFAVDAIAMPFLHGSVRVLA